MFDTVNLFCKGPSKKGKPLLRDINWLIDSDMIFFLFLNKEAIGELQAVGKILAVILNPSEWSLTVQDLVVQKSSFVLFNRGDKSALFMY